MEADRAHVYAWLARSDVTPSMMGPPRFADHPVPTWGEFCADYEPHYFDGSAPRAGRCFIIVVDGEDVGVVGYNRIDPASGECELDIWLRSERDCGKGYGSDALQVLCDFLRRSMGVVRAIIRPSLRNERAIAAYRRAGFEMSALSADEQEARYGEGDYGDTVTLVKDMAGRSVEGGAMPQSGDLEEPSGFGADGHRPGHSGGGA
jgi:diamine N-acetyltransferase